MKAALAAALILCTCWIFLSLRKPGIAEKQTWAHIFCDSTAILFGLSLFCPTQPNGGKKLQTFRTPSLNLSHWKFNCYLHSIYRNISFSHQHLCEPPSMIALSQVPGGRICLLDLVLLVMMHLAVRTQLSFGKWSQACWKGVRGWQHL